ncbi:peptidoglycan-binding protein [Streptomyces monticola]|uniref:Peptidoglycan-binding protein n=2 Tax=Streptomyces monticola TaxID=2666263 RepID=A0ABW2JH63_9ACTN
MAVAAAAGTVFSLPHTASATGQAEQHHSRPEGPSRPEAGTAEDPDGSPQGGSAALYGSAGKPAPGARSVTRAEIINRAKRWVAAKVPYDMDKFFKDGYRQDCSGFVSMAWNLGRNEWTGSLAKYAVRIGREQLQPGDILLFHNQADPEKGSHVTIFGGWTDYTHTYYIAYEQARPHARKQATPYAYWSQSKRYAAYRYKNLRAAAPGPAAGAAQRYPGAAAFGPGARSPYVTQLGRLLVQRGGGRFYRSGPSPVWGEADRRATQAFQRAQGWSGRDADGLPGPRTWTYLVTGKGRDIPAGAAGAAGAAGPAGAGTAGAGTAGTAADGAAQQASGAAQGVPAYPGKGAFRPGRSGPHVTLLGRQLVKKGFGKSYARGPGPRWGESDRRAVEAFQRAQGWRGGAADGYPGPETWRRLFS